MTARYMSGLCHAGYHAQPADALPIRVPGRDLACAGQYANTSCKCACHKGAA